ncbi:tail fiber protein [Paenibacillus rubinfantis]|uniref:tail fiber protein n=1 Tax=Paenibacillus rubinfantis TaxID=1720296 RepID=UPI00073F6A0C|nr:phage tail protein [Paenibacillus rubinfantis]
MATNTPNLNLLKKDPIADGNETFNIQTMLNENWDKIDEAIGGINFPDASLTVKGKVQLSNETDSSAEDRAATSRAVKAVSDSFAAQLVEKADQSALTSHANLTTAHGATSVATASRIIVRDAAGRAKVAAPSASDDIALKSTVDNAVGTLSNLLTTAKGNAVAAINELFTSASNGKDAVAAAITGKGVAASGSDTFAQLATKIGQIITGRRYGSGIDTRVSGSSLFTVSGLGFKPSMVRATLQTNSAYRFYIFVPSTNAFGVAEIISNNSSLSSNTGNATVPLVFDGGWQINSNNVPLGNYVWEAWE